MVVEEELERTFLAKFLPEGLNQCEFVDLIDNYIPKNSNHPILRIRKKGNKTVITKKYKKNEGDASVMVEETILLDSEEHKFLNQLEGKKFSKKRFLYEYKKDHMCKVDVYQKDLKDLVVIDFEFSNLEDKEKFLIPNFCLVEITNEEFLVGGMLCGKSYEDLKDNLTRFNYKKLEENE